jgi:hypothetical protein
VVFAAQFQSGLGSLATRVDEHHHVAPHLTGLAPVAKLVFHRDVHGPLGGGGRSRGRHGRGREPEHKQTGEATAVS